MILNYPLLEDYWFIADLYPLFLKGCQVIFFGRLHRNIYCHKKSLWKKCVPSVMFSSVQLKHSIRAFIKTLKVPVLNLSFIYGRTAVHEDGNKWRLSYNSSNVSNLIWSPVIHSSLHVSKYFSALLKFLFPNSDYNAVMWLFLGYSICISMHLFAVLFFLCVFYFCPVNMRFSFFVRM